MIPEQEGVCWDCRGLDLPCDTCNGTRRVLYHSVSDEREKEIEEEIERLLGSDDLSQNDY